MKEEGEVVKREVSSVEAQIEDLQSSCIDGNKNIEHELSLTMVDHKIINFLTGTKGAANCYICKAKSSQMNAVISLNVSMEVDDMHNSYKFGLSPLHA